MNNFKRYRKFFLTEVTVMLGKEAPAISNGAFDFAVFSET